ncbi:hypothetical protein JDV02_003840 [Purpureocillium takamizusanense]|uniref:CUE domain-containing protein n=1 Tax=Purpureocillium takamizusanense TaxID=2060973 RepID=A0A9Q8QD68_9HYPO|nr:uncharacterized protein JDV02_003840 [Purpureocillium takamizusanense]UNI17500.1 hypothetical protein JDV02_003840 [Purpureocillium takamizusanense]
MPSLPPLAPYPKASWQQRLSPQEWETLLETWTLLCQAYLALPDDEFRSAASDESVAAFAATYVIETATSPPSPTSTQLSRLVFQLTSRLLTLEPPPHQLLQYSFLCGLAKLYQRKRVAPLVANVFARHAAPAEASLAALKKLLILHLDSGIKGDLKLVESHLSTVNPLLHASPHACALFLAGSDFFDGLVTCFKVMNPPLRKVIVTTTYLCLVGLTEAEPPKWAMLSDELFSLKSAADAHKLGPLNVNDSLVAELVTATPLLKVLMRRAQDSSAASDSLKKRITALEPFKKGAMVRPKRLAKRRLDKGKGKATHDDAHAEMHIHRMSQITQVQDLFPDLGAGFVSKCLDEYHDDVEQVVANLLSETLPPHLATADRSEPLFAHQEAPVPDMAPRPTPPLVPTRRNVFDDDEFDRLAADVSQISFGKKPGKTADDVLKDRSTAPNKAAILSALATFDSDDDERDDTYDAADVGGTVDSTNQEEESVNDRNEETLFRAYQTDPKVFDRDAATRRGAARAGLRQATDMADEAIEGWALMLTRNAQQKKRLELKYAFSGQQAQLERTAWRSSPAGSGTEDSDADAGAGRGGRGARGGGRGGGRGRGRGRGGGRGGSVAGPTGERETEAARRNKEAHKGARANHNRRDARAKKMARGGFPG